MASSALSAPAPAANDYGKPEAWLCLPGHPGACDRDLSVTVVAADGTLRVQPFKANPRAPVDCIYLYPTASNDPTGNSDMIAGPEEQGAAWVFLGRYGSVCRTFAPLYRSVTLAALVGGHPTTPPDPDLAYRDVRDAWSYYLAHYNHGRGVVLIGHSQGATLWARLLREDVDGKPVAKKIVSAILMGEPARKPLKGFASLPPCQRPDQFGCVIRYSSFRSTTPPTASAIFGRGESCVNPAALGGGSGVLHPIFLSVIRKDNQSWVNTGAHVTTPFVSLPGLLSAECVHDGEVNYLSVTVHGDPADPRVDDIAGDMVLGGRVDPNWGMHGVEPSLAMDDLIAIVGAQGRAFAQRRSTAARR